jgi:cyclopropane fatty-acyl-phospholipid synthase-like methyltransferase
MMSNAWSDPGLVLLGGTVIVPGTHLFVGAVLWKLVGVKAAVLGMLAVFASCWIWYNYFYIASGPAPIDTYVKFEDEETKKQWSGRRIPIMELCELYMKGHVTFKKDCYEILANHRNEFVNYKLTWSVIRFLLLQLFPNSENSSMKHLQATKKEIAEHYDRGNDFFAAFLGPRMVYTSGVFEGLDQSLETAQDNKMSLLCDKLMLQKDETILDIGCGWGTLCRHAAKKYGAKAVGVTLSVEGAKYCREQAKAEGVGSQVDILCMDYRMIPQEMKFDKIVSVEMAEHVGLKNFPLYLSSVRDMLKDDGMFIMQVAGLRQGANWEDINWGLFMSRYIFPGADASTPCHWYVHQLERAGFEVRSVETIGRHYSHTLHKWYDNFQKNRPAMEKKYGGYLCRLWDFFLAWSVIASGQGSATCYQFLVHKNSYTFPRDIFSEKSVAKQSVGMKCRD